MNGGYSIHFVFPTTLMGPPKKIPSRRRFFCREKSNVHRTFPSNANKKLNFPIKVYIFELADLSASQRCKMKFIPCLYQKLIFSSSFFFTFASFFKDKN